MLTLVLTAVPAGLRGDLTKWLLEISPGVFVGNVSARIRESLWGRVITESRDGRALLVYSTNSEQGLAFLSNNHDWAPEDFDGVLLMRRPDGRKNSSQRPAWSMARAQQRARNPAWAKRLHNDKPTPEPENDD